MQTFTRTVSESEPQTDGRELEAILHELRTPLTSLRGALGLIIGGVVGPLPAPARDSLYVAQRSVERLSHLVDELVDMDAAPVAAKDVANRHESAPRLPTAND